MVGGVCPDQRAALRPNQRGSGVRVGGEGACNRNCLPRPSVRPSRLRSLPLPSSLPPVCSYYFLRPSRRRAALPPLSTSAATFTARCLPRPLHCANVTVSEHPPRSRGSACRPPVLCLCISHRRRLCRHALAAVREGSAPWVRGGCDPDCFFWRKEYTDPRGRCGLCGALRLPSCATTELRPRGREFLRRFGCTQFPGRLSRPPARLPCRPPSLPPLPPAFPAAPSARLSLGAG